MSVLGKRIARLEGPASPYLPPIGVVSAPIPSVVTIDWAMALLATYGWTGQHLAVSVQDGDPALLLLPTPYAWVKGDAETTWLGAHDSYPNAVIMSGVGVVANRFDSEADLREWMIETERSLAA